MTPAVDLERPVDHLSAEAAARIVAGAGRSAQTTALSSVEGKDYPAVHLLQGSWSFSLWTAS